MRKIFLLVLFLSLIGCTSKENTMDKYGFKDVGELKFTHLDLDEYIYMPTWVEVFDSLLLVYDPVEENNYTIYNLNTLQPVINGGNKGEGPDDIMYGQFVDKIDNKRFQVSDLANRKILVYNVDSILHNKEFKPIRRIFYSLYEENVNGSIQIMYNLNDTVNIGLGPFDNGKYAILNENWIDYWGNYPDEPKTERNPFYTHQGVIQVNRERNRFLYHCPLGLYYEIYEYAHGFNRIGGEYVLTEFVSGISTVNTIYGINSADFSEDEIFMLFSGRTDKETESPMFADNILVCDMDGNKKKCYKTDRNTVCIGLDSQKRRIYCVTQNPDTFELEIGYYKY